MDMHLLAGLIRLMLSLLIILAEMNIIFQEIKLCMPFGRYSVISMPTEKSPIPICCAFPVMLRVWIHRCQSIKRSVQT